MPTTVSTSTNPSPKGHFQPTNTGSVSLTEHLTSVKEGRHRFENAFQGVSRMILDGGIEKVVVNGKTTYDFKLFRKGLKHVIGMYDEVNSFVSYVKDAAEGGSSKEMAFVLVGEPGNGKTFFVDFLAGKYRQFLAREENRKFTFRFVHLDRVGSYGRITTIESQTYEDPMILAMSLYEDPDENREWLTRTIGFSDREIETFYENYRPLGACSSYIWNDIRARCGGDLDEMLEYVEVTPVPLNESLGTITGKYPAKDKITSSAVDLLGEESIQRMLHISDTNNPYRFDLRRGALARVAGGGIHFSDEIFKNKKDLVQVYLGVIQNRTIEIDGYKWPIDTLIVATSNNSEFHRFLSEKEEAPIVDRCRLCYVSHNTNYKLQRDLTGYAIGSETRTTLTKEALHQDPNLNYAASVAVVLSRLPRSEKLSAGRDHETRRRRGGRREEHQDPGRGDRHPEPGPRDPEPLRPEGSGAAQHGTRDSAADRKLRDQRGRMHVRLRRLQGTRADRARLRPGRERPVQVPGGHQDGARPCTANGS